jgi:DNA (cytosine-5)-methyltransferase 1
MELFDLMDFHVFNAAEQKIRLFEAFSGIGTQSMALKKITDNYEIVGYSEIDKYAIESYKAIHGEDIKNYGDISKIDQLPECDICTWSFPCQDISLAGNQKGMVEGTRSNYGYEFLETVKRSTHKPKVLIMENVKALVSDRFKEDFNQILETTKLMGYVNHWAVLNAKHYGVAQNRERVFVVSIMNGDYFHFPSKIKLKKRLKDYLEESVDEKYYLSDKMLNFFIQNSKNNEEKGNGFRFKPHNKNAKSAYAITTRNGSRMDDNFVKMGNYYTWPDNQGNIKTQCNRASKEDSIALTVATGNTPKVLIPEDTKRGYKEAYEGDGVYLDRPHQKRGCVQKGMIQTIKTSGNDVGGVTKGMRIRKLTPKECWRLMGIHDNDYHKAAQVVSNTQLFKQAGNAIVVDVIEAILRKLIKCS